VINSCTKKSTEQLYVINKRKATQKTKEEKRTVSGLKDEETTYFL